MLKLDRESKRESKLEQYKKLVFFHLLHTIFLESFLHNQEVLRFKSEFSEELMRKLMEGRR